MADMAGSKVLAKLILSNLLLEYSKKVVFCNHLPVYDGKDH